MNICNIQKEYIKEQILNSLVKKGIEPTVYEVNNLINDYFLNYEKGHCIFKPLDIKNYTISNKDEYNKAFKNLNIDINILSNAIKEIETEIALKEDLIMNKKKNIINNLKSLQYKINSLNQNLTSKINYESKEYVFNDFNEIDEDQTSAFIDLKHKNIQSQMIECEQIHYDNSVINISYQGTLIESNNNINYLKNFNKDCYYSLKVSSKSNTNKIDISIAFEEPISASLIKVSLNSIQDITGYITIYTKDNYIYDLYTVSFNEEGEWNFNYSDITNITIHLNKNIADGFLDNEYIYEYYINNISIYNVKYELDSRYISKPIVFNNIIDKVYINKDNTIIQNSCIDYLLGVIYKNSTFPTEWFMLQDKKYFDLGSKFLELKDDIFNLKTPSYGESIYDNCYKIGTIDKYINKNSLKILNGYQQWNVKVINKPSFNKDYIIDINDYDTNCLIDELNLDCESYKIKCATNKLIIFTTNVYCDSESYSSGHYIKLADDNDCLQYSVIVNNNTQIPTNDVYTLGFSKGKNKIIILAYISDKEETKINLKDVIFNFNFKEVTLNIASGNEMKKVSLDELKYNIGEDKPDYYAVDNDNNIIIKYNPLQAPSKYIKGTIKKSNYNYQDYLRFYVVYKRLKEEAKPYLLNNGGVEYSITAAALFYSTDEKVSSRLNGYTLLIQ